MRGTRDKRGAPWLKKFGYDTKNAAHLVRLLRMGMEFLKDGELEVTRLDARQLLEIKRGEWTLERVKAEADHGFKMAEQAYLDSARRSRSGKYQQACS